MVETPSHGGQRELGDGTPEGPRKGSASNLARRVEELRAAGTSPYRTKCALVSEGFGKEVVAQAVADYEAREQAAGMRIADARLRRIRREGRARRQRGRARAPGRRVRDRLIGVGIFLAGLAVTIVLLFGDKQVVIFWLFPVMMIFAGIQVIIEPDNLRHVPAWLNWGRRR